MFSGISDVKASVPDFTGYLKRSLPFTIASASMPTPLIEVNPLNVFIPVCVLFPEIVWLVSTVTYLFGRSTFISRSYASSARSALFKAEAAFFFASFQRFPTVALFTDKPFSVGSPSCTVNDAISDENCVIYFVGSVVEYNLTNNCILHSPDIFSTSSGISIL